MATATVVATVAFGIPIGRLADKIGRKRVVFLLAPLWYASNLLLVYAQGSIMLILSAMFLVFNTISTGATGAMTMEIVPVEQQGKWGGLLGLFTGLLTIPASIVGGVIWEQLGPVYVFLIPLGLDLLFRIPLLTTVSDTLELPQ